MMIVGLTGSIGMGKSTVAGFFRAAGVPVHDADAAVHRLYEGRAVPLVEVAFPGTTAHGVVDRGKLGAAVLGRSEALKRLESLIHPLVRAEEEAFLATSAKAGRAIVVLDIPLLFETGAEHRCDAIVVVSTSAEAQARRVLSRSDMTVEKFNAILAKQLPDAEKRARAHVVIDTSGSFEATRRQVEAVVRMFAAHPGRQGRR